MINAGINPNFNSETEMVITKSDFVDERIFGVRADKSSSELFKNTFINDERVILKIEFWDI